MGEESQANERNCVRKWGREGRKWAKCGDQMRKTRMRKYIELNKERKTRARRRARDAGSKVVGTRLR
jgi:hypothetical protein